MKHHHHTPQAALFNLALSHKETVLNYLKSVLVSNKLNYVIGDSCSTVVECSTADQEFKGSNPASHRLVVRETCK